MYNKYFRLEEEKGFIISSSWERDYGDIAYNVLLYENNKNIADVIICMDETIKDLSEATQIKEIREYLENSFEELKSLPKLSKTSKLMQEMVDSVCVSEAQMCHVTNEDWFYYKETYNDIDLKSLKKEVEKYNLSNYLQVGSSTEEYVIVGYGDLPTLFNDDRSLSKELIEIESDTIQQSIQDEEDKKEDYGMEM